MYLLSWDNDLAILTPTFTWSLNLHLSQFRPYSNFIPQPIGKCRRVFQALLPYAVEELCNVAESLIVPVRMGIARPTAPFTLASTSIDAVQGSEELFSVEPLPPRPSPDQSSRSVLYVSVIMDDVYVNILYLWVSLEPMKPIVNDPGLVSFFFQL